MKIGAINGKIYSRVSIAAETNSLNNGAEKMVRQGDGVSISSNARLLQNGKLNDGESVKMEKGNSAERLDIIKYRINNRFYDNPDIKNKIVDKLYESGILMPDNNSYRYEGYF